MAKTPKTPPVSQLWVVTLGAGRWEVEAVTADEAVDKVIAAHELLRDRRNFVAIPKAQATKQGS